MAVASVARRRGREIKEKTASEGEGKMGSERVCEEVRVVEEKPSLVFERPVAIEGLPDVGLVGTIATTFLVEKKGFEEIAYLESDLFPPVMVVHEGRLKNPFRIYGGYLMRGEETSAEGGGGGGEGEEGRKDKEGEEIYTHIHIKLFKEAPMSSEHFLSLTRNGVFHVDEATHTFIATTKLRGLNLPEENIAHRLKFTVAARLTGTERGKVFIYRVERLSSPAHNVFGEVVEGSPLVQFAKKGDKIRVQTTPKWLMCVGMTQKEAEAFLAAENIQHVREGNKDDDAVVVEQEPEMTMDVLESGTVKTFGVSREAVLPVQFFHKEAPKTVWYFRKVSGMVTKPIGRLKVFFVIPGSIVLFEGKTSEAGLLVPENTPKGSVERGVLGVTNMAKTNRGMMGIRLEESREYGPTGEAFEHTNIALRISPLTPEIITVLSKLKEGDVIYVKEVSTGE